MLPTAMLPSILPLVDFGALFVTAAWMGLIGYGLVELGELAL